MQPVYGGSKSTFMFILSSGKMPDCYLVISLWLSKPNLVMITFQWLLWDLGLLFPSSYGSWIPIYLCSHCHEDCQFWFLHVKRCTLYNIIWYSLSVTCSWSGVFSRYSRFLHEKIWHPQYKWSQIESCVKDTCAIIMEEKRKWKI